VKFFLVAAIMTIVPLNSHASTDHVIL
jgi:hypothetical protein